MLMLKTTPVVASKWCHLCGRTAQPTMPQTQWGRPNCHPQTPKFLFYWFGVVKPWSLNKYTPCVTWFHQKSHSPAPKHLPVVKVNVATFCQKWLFIIYRVGVEGADASSLLLCHFCRFLFRSRKSFFYPHNNELLMVWERPWSPSPCKYRALYSVY